MGRKANNTEATETSVVETQVTHSMDGSAIGIAKTSTGGYTVLKMEFNSSTNEMIVTKTFDVGTSKMEAAERFKVLAVEEGLVV